MRLILEIDDNAFKAAVEQQVGLSIASIAEKIILDKVDEILEKKAERMVKHLSETANKGLEKAIRSFKILK